MKSMKDFAAQQLSKKEMNNVKGGMIHCNVVFRTGTGMSGYVDADTTEEAAAQLRAIYDGIEDIESVHCD